MTAGGPTGAGEARLLERDSELSAMSSLLERSAAGAGGAIVVEGAGGLGKSALLAATAARAEQSGMRVASARGAELEQTFPYGVVRQFFESFLFTVAPEERPRWMRESAAVARRLAAGEGSAAEEFAVLHGLYWLCVEIADERPLLMVLDDAQWADEPSLQFMAFLVRRLERLPIAVAIGTRPPASDGQPVHRALVSDATLELLRPQPLSPSAVRSWVQRDLDERADPAFSRACHEVTSGNPFLLSELVREVAAERIATSAEAAARVRSLGPQGVARVVALRLGRLSEHARRLASALAVASPDSPLRDVAQLAELGEAQAADAVAALQSADVVEAGRGIRFAHPIIHSAVYEDLPVATRSALHARAAQLAEQRGASASEIAGHVLHVSPGEDRRVVEVLVAAAEESLAAGDFAAAERLLERALEEHVGERDLLADVRARLGRAQARTGNPAGVANLERAIAEAGDEERATAMAIELANVLKFELRPELAADALIVARDRLGERSDELARRLDAELLGTRFLTAATTERVRARLAGIEPPAGEPADLLDAFLLAAAAFDAVAELEPVAAALDYGRRALAGEVIPSNPALGGQALVVASVALIWAEDFEFVFGLFSQALREGREQGSPLLVGNASAMRAMCGYRGGRLREAEADAATVLELSEEVTGLQALLAPAVAYATLSGIERGRELRELTELAFDPRVDAGRDTLPFTQLDWARGELCLARGEWERAIACFEACDRPEPGYGGGNPSMLAWREGTAQALSRLGEERRARELAAEAVRLAERFGAARALGVALRAEGLVADRAERLDPLERSVGVLEHAGSPLELARSRVDLGAALRAAGRRGDAQDQLQSGLALAREIGAQRIASQALAELGAAGVRPRRERIEGVEGLTPSERRVAELAAGGKTNREIAQELFVTEKTVETHLGHVYDKLGVRSRRALPELLGVVA